MKIISKIPLLLILKLTLLATDKPNIIFMLADDLGYGDLGAFNPEGKIKTPHLDQMAHQGMIFTDAHTSSSVCTPTRYGILTGRYNWRSPLKKGVLGGFKDPLIKKSRITIADYLKAEGYKTALIGKWHLGIGWQKLPKGQKITPEKNLVNNPKAKPGIGQGWNVDYTKKIDGPIEHGFDYFWGCGASLDMPPYVYLENDTILSIPTVVNSFNRRPGPAAADFDASQTLIHTAEKARQYIAEQKPGAPFFLYLPYTMPHLPVFADEPFQGKSLAGPYGDTIEEIDWSVGQIISALEKAGIDDNTLVFFSSDNGPWQLASIHLAGSTGPFKGSKQDIYEGGVRVPGIFWWPGTIAPEVISDMGSVLDLYQTIAAILELDTPQTLDSHNLSPVLLESQASPREELAFYRKGELRAYRKGDFKLHLFDQPQGGEPLEMPELYNLKRDLGEKDNIADTHPEIVADILSAVATHEANMPRKPPLFDQRFVDMMNRAADSGR